LFATGFIGVLIYDKEVNKSSVSAASEWSQDFVKDFNKGTFINIQE